MTHEQQILSIKQVVVSLLQQHNEDDQYRPVSDTAGYDLLRRRAQAIGSLRDVVETLAQNFDIPLHFYEFTDAAFLDSISVFTPGYHPSPERGEQKEL